MKPLRRADPQSRGLGVPPMNAAGMGETPKPHEPDVEASIQKRQGTYLPHWTRTGATYAVTFRLADSLPRAVLEAWLFERRDIIRTAEQRWTAR